MAQAQVGTATLVDKPLEWRIDDAPVPYPAALAFMDERVAAIHAGRAPETVWLLEHPALYTAGTSARDSDLLAPAWLPVFRAGRGGQFTYHGPGQRVAYVMLDLGRRGADVRRFVGDLEAWIIAALARFNVKGERRHGRVGIWIDRARDKGPGREDKIAAIGVRVRRWVTLHGIALNVDPDLALFRGIVPCGVADERYGTTSLADLGLHVQMAEVDAALRAVFREVFGAAARR
jgi:lipoyl(octanoyl) transferase